MQSPVELRAGQSILTVSPSAGGSITRYATELDGGRLEWLRPATADAIERRAAGETGCFPLVPFSNRIRDGRFHFQGRLIELPQDFQPEPHAIHGHGWRARWQVVDHTPTTTTLEYRHAADTWPWDYRTRQAFELAPDRLSVRMSVTNDSSQPMPVGFGLHPYFVRTPRSRLRAAVGAMWRSDDNRMPVELVSPPADLLMNGSGLNPDATALDNNFVEFGGRAVVEWPEWDAALDIETDDVFGCFVVYTPRGRDFFCAEPATNCIDGFNLADMGRTDTGIIVLGPGETTRGTVTLSPRRNAGLR